MSPLVEACRNRDIAIVDLLLKHGARDDDCRALAVVVKNKDDILTAKLLSIKVSVYDCSSFFVLNLVTCSFVFLSDCKYTCNVNLNLQCSSVCKK